MTITMDDSQVRTLEQIRAILKSSRGLEFKGIALSGKYSWIEGVLNRFGYFSLSKKDKGVVKAYLLSMTGFSRAQLTRLVSRKLTKGSVNAAIAKRNHFETEIHGPRQGATGPDRQRA